MGIKQMIRLEDLASQKYCPLLNEFYIEVMVGITMRKKYPLAEVKDVDDEKKPAWMKPTPGCSRKGAVAETPAWMKPRSPRRSSPSPKPAQAVDLKPTKVRATAHPTASESEAQTKFKNLRSSERHTRKPESSKHVQGQVNFGTRKSKKDRKPAQAAPTEYSQEKLMKMNPEDLREAAEKAVAAGMKKKYLDDKYFGFMKAKLVEQIFKKLGGESRRRLMARIERFARDSVRCQNSK